MGSLLKAISFRQPFGGLDYMKGFYWTHFRLDGIIIWNMISTPTYTCLTNTW